ncbi:expressed unknown protein [Seminavis robusta]|uniref:Uncharacterized protein n=1 Tax=Seminavis robusta TaxID=568900 RepID=A0A9N8DL62_9STRA|nr:expressed unknown protein [Seminavis robusta]|eukprot:Sro216_g089190.1 n/a (452) ;mRNA; r:2174-3666
MPVAIAWTVNQPTNRTPSAEIIKRFHLVGKQLSGVRSLIISPHCEEDDDYTDAGNLPIRALGDIMTINCRTLQHVALRQGLLLTGSEQDYQYTCRCIAETKQLQSFQMLGCGVFNGDRLLDVESSLTDSLFAALAELPLLGCVELDRMSLNTPGGLTRFCSNSVTTTPSLKLSNTLPSEQELLSMCDHYSRLVKLELCNIPNINQHIELMASSLKQNVTTKQLEIHCPRHLSCEEAMPIWNMLEENHGLQTMGLALQCSSEYGYKEPMGKALQKMQSLQQLHLHLHDANQTRRLESACFLLEHLQRNQSLTEFQLCLEEYGESLHDLQCIYTERLNESIAGALQTNATLLKVSFSINRRTCRTPLSEDVEIWLRYNRAGRRSLELHPEDRQLWVRTILKHTDDTPIVFQILMANPALCLSPARTVRSTQRKRKRLLQSFEGGNRSHMQTIA